MIPVAFPADTIILTNPQGAAPVSCLPSGGFVLAQNLTDLCDVVIISPSTGQIIEYNGTQWVNVASTTFNDTTTCTNIGTGTAYVCVEGTNVDLRSLLAGAGISVSNNTNTITITNTAPDNTVCANVGAGSQVYKDGECNFRTLTEGANIDLTQNTDDITIAVTGITGESTVCTNLGSVGEGIYVSGNCNFKKLLAGSGITLSSNGTRITITNSLPEATVCNNVGTGNQLCSGGNVNIDTLIAGTGITISDTTDDWTFASQCANTGTGEPVCESSNNINSLIASTGITIADTTGDLTVTNTGVISNTCSLGIVCSGTNPSAFTADWQLLCSATGTGATLSCSSFPARTYLHISIIYVSGSGGTAMTPAYQFNSDTGANYSWRNSNNGGADTTNTGVTSCTIRGANSIASNGGGIIILGIENVSALRKIVRGNEGTGMDSSSATAPSKNDNTCKWDNTASQITTITLTTTGGTNTYTTGTQISVWGHN